LPAKFREKGIRLSDGLAYLNYLLELVRSGRLPGLSKAKLMRYGKQLTFFPGIPELFSVVREDVEQDERRRDYGITLEHYIISRGHAEMIRESRVAPFVDGILACEFLENEIADAAKHFFERS
jgi:molybdopterin-biosynthesis enzyme MoeA-like protein